MKQRCDWCDRKRTMRYKGRVESPTPRLTIAHVCKRACAAQWNRWCRNSGMQPYVFRDMQGRFVSVPVLQLGDIQREP